jgi:hypothetical protein
MKNNTNKKPASGSNNPSRKEGNRKLDYFERRFMTDEEHEKFRQHLIDVGIIKLNDPPSYLTSEQAADLKAKMIANGTLIPRAQRANRARS